MGVKSTLRSIKEDVTDILNCDINIGATNSVPSDEDGGLTFTNGESKKCKEIETCVLYIDIRKSTDLSFKHQPKTLAKLYSAFVRSMLHASGEFEGVIRNIVGDRVMVVFPANDCIKNAVKTAALLNTIGHEIIDKLFKNNSIQFGIGIDFGKMLVVKVGKAVQGKERAAYKDLVWMGKPANVASKLTDFANKDLEFENYHVKRNPVNPRAVGGIFGQRDPNAPFYLNTVEDVVLSANEFASDIRMLDNGEVYMVGGKVISFEKKVTKTKAFPILMSKKVYEGYKPIAAENQKLDDNWARKEEFYIIDTIDEIYGCKLGFYDTIKELNNE